jgi:hypothetical protein
MSTNDEPEAVELLDRAGMRDRVDRRFVDIAQVTNEVELADIVPCTWWSAAIPTTDGCSLRRAASPTGCCVQLPAAQRGYEDGVVVGQRQAKTEGEQLRTFAPPVAMLACSPRPGSRAFRRAWRTP